MKRDIKSSAKFVFTYFVFASLWVWFSDKAVELLSSNTQVYTLVQSLKGMLFVVVTSLLLWGQVKKNNRELEQANDIDSAQPFGIFSLPRTKNPKCQRR